MKKGMIKLSAPYPNEKGKAFENAFGPNADKILGDLANFTNIEPILQVSEVII